MTYRLLYPPVPFLALDDLSDSTLTSRAKFNDLFTIPFLELVKVTSTDDDNSTIYPMIHAAWQSFNDMELRDTSQVRNVNVFALNMASVLPIVPQTLSVGQFVQAYGAVVDKYVEIADASQDQTKSFYTQFSQQIGVIEQSLSRMNQVISQLTTQIEQKNQEIQKENALNTLYKSLKQIFTLAKGEEAVVDMLRMTLADLDQTFETMSQPLLQQLVLQLKQLRDAYASAYSKADALQRSLSDTVQYSKSMNGTWTSLQSDFKKIKSDNSLFPSDQQTINYIIKDWNTVKDVAQQYLQKKSANGLAGQPNPPLTNSEYINVMANSKSVSPQISSLLMTGTGTGVTSYSASHVIVRSALPTNMEDMLNQISKDSGRIVSLLKRYLSVPSLNEIKIQGTMDLKTRFQDLLNAQQTIQEQSAPFIKQLYTFIDKKVMLPNAVFDDNFIKTNKVLVQKFKESSVGLLNQHLEFKKSFQQLESQLFMFFNQNSEHHFAVLSMIQGMDELLQNTVSVISFALNSINQDTTTCLQWMEVMETLVQPLPQVITKTYKDTWQSCLPPIASYAQAVTNVGSR